MTIEEVNLIACQIIAHAGDSKSYLMEAIENAEQHNFEEAEENLKHGNESIVLAHEIHTKLLVEEARDPGCVPASMMLIHASNHLSSAETVRDLAERFVRVYQHVK
ncbi:MAG: PTS lactose/cellobiose transporter subunit IIA [Traorella sp.]